MTEEEEAKIISQYRLHLHKVLKPLRLYGQSTYVDTVTEELVSLALQLHQKMEGLDIPYHINLDKLHW